MHIRDLLSDIKVPLQHALDLLSPHFAEIETAWRKRLAGLGIKEEACDVLSPLMLKAQCGNLQLPTFDTYSIELDRQAKVLERSGVSEGDTAAAYTCYLEACLPFLLGSRPKTREYVLAITRLIATSQFLTLSSYATEWVNNWRKLQDRERQNLSRDLHDDIGHNLLVLKLYLEMMANDLKKDEIASLQSKLEEALALVSYSVDSVRRLMLDLGPAMLAQFGFAQALKIYARQFTLRTGIDVRLEQTTVPENLPASYETALYRVVQGALSNVVRHSRAKHVIITLGTMKKSFFLSIEDDGIGFDVPNMLSRQVFGLTAMRERVETLGGKFHIESSPTRPGTRKHGTRIELDLPLGGEVQG